MSNLSLRQILPMDIAGQRVNDLVQQSVSVLHGVSIIAPSPQVNFASPIQPDFVRILREVLAFKYRRRVPVNVQGITIRCSLDNSRLRRITRLATSSRYSATGTWNNASASHSPVLARNSSPSSAHCRYAQRTSHAACRTTAHHSRRSPLHPPPYGGLPASSQDGSIRRAATRFYHCSDVVLC